MTVFVKFCDTYLGGDRICIVSLYSLAMSISPEMISKLGSNAHDAITSPSASYPIV